MLYLIEYVDSNEYGEWQHCVLVFTAAVIRDLEVSANEEFDVSRAEATTGGQHLGNQTSPTTYQTAGFPSRGNLSISPHTESRPPTLSSAST